MKNSSQKPPDSTSRIPTDPPPNLNTPERQVRIGYRPVGGRAAAWTIGVVHSLFTRNNKNANATARLPDPHYHWCVLVGEYYHQMQITNGVIWYDNNKTSWKDGWSVFEVGMTKFNDAAIADTATKTVLGMPDSYDLWNNNCHHFVLKLLDHICTTDDHWQKLGTHRYRRHRRSISSGSAARLFAEGGPLYKSVVDSGSSRGGGGGGGGGGGDGDGDGKMAVVNKAEDIMAQNTPRITPDELRTTSQANQEDYFGQHPNP